VVLRFFVAVLVIIGVCCVFPANSYAEYSYLALGDSFTSGEGESSDDYYLFSQQPYSYSCHLSSRSYPYLVALSVNALGSKSVACSGARLVDIYGTDDYLGQGNRLSGMPVQDASTAQVHALTSYSPGLIPQAIFAQRYQPDLLTIGIGGNDIGMVDKLKVCLMPSTCPWAAVDGQDERTKMAREVRGLFDALVVTYQFLSRLTPDSRFYVLGYPQIINASSSCDLFTNTLFSDSEKSFMNEAIVYLNAVLQQAARHVGFSFINQESAFDGHMLCDATLAPAMNAIRSGDDIAPVSMFRWLKVFGNESFHPTPFGHGLLSMAIVEKLQADAVDGFSKIIIPQPDLGAPSPPDYWNEDDRPLPKSINTSMVESDLVEAQDLLLTFPDSAFMHDSVVDIVIRSEETKLASVQAHHNGALRVTVSLPQGLTMGFHTVIARGDNPEGEEVEHYQVIHYIPLADNSEGITFIAEAPTDSSNNLSQNFSETQKLVAMEFSVLGTDIVVQSKTVSLDEKMEHFWVYVGVIMMVCILLVVFIRLVVWKGT